MTSKAKAVSILTFTATCAGPESALPGRCCVLFLAEFPQHSEGSQFSRELSLFCVAGSGLIG